MWLMIRRKKNYLAKQNRPSLPQEWQRPAKYKSFCKSLLVAALLGMLSVGNAVHKLPYKLDRDHVKKALNSE